jgi:hypothetical protein
MPRSTLASMIRSVTSLRFMVSPFVMDECGEDVNTGAPVLAAMALGALDDRHGIRAIDAAARANCGTVSGLRPSSACKTSTMSMTGMTSSLGNTANRLAQASCHRASGIRALLLTHRGAIRALAAATDRIAHHVRAPADSGSTSESVPVSASNVGTSPAMTGSSDTAAGPAHRKIFARLISDVTPHYLALIPSACPSVRVTFLQTLASQGLAGYLSGQKTGGRRVAA